MKQIRVNSGNLPAHKGRFLAPSFNVQEATIFTPSGLIPVT